jgi:hypothetical protein
MMVLLKSPELWVNSAHFTGRSFTLAQVASE